MQISETLLKQMGALFYEETLMEAYELSTISEDGSPLKESKENVTHHVTKAREGKSSLTEGLNGQSLKVLWYAELGTISRIATQRLHEWIESNGPLSPSVDGYINIDEKGRIYRAIPFSSIEDGGGFVYEIYHLPSSYIRDDGGRGGPYTAADKAFLPLFGWPVSKSDFQELVKQERIAYGQHPWSGIHQKDFLK